MKFLGSSVVSNLDEQEASITLQLKSKIKHPDSDK